jgi:hypothetical protein
VDVLESNWKLVRNILQQTHHILIHMFFGFWSKKKDEMPGNNLQKLVAAFDTIEDPVHAMKRISVKQCIKGANERPIAWRGSELGESWCLIRHPFG